MNGDKPYRVFFPEPIVLHGADERRMVEVALEYLRQSGKIRIEPLFAPEEKGTASRVERDSPSSIGDGICAQTARPTQL